MGSLATSAGGFSWVVTAALRYGHWLAPDWHEAQKQPQIVVFATLAKLIVVNMARQAVARWLLKLVIEIKSPGLGRGPACYALNGLSSGTPNGLKSATLRVTTVKP